MHTLHKINIITLWKKTWFLIKKTLMVLFQDELPKNPWTSQPLFPCSILSTLSPVWKFENLNGWGPTLADHPRSHPPSLLRRTTVWSGDHQSQHQGLQPVAGDHSSFWGRWGGVRWGRAFGNPRCCALDSSSSLLSFTPCSSLSFFSAVSTLSSHPSARPLAAARLAGAFLHR